MTIHVWDYEGRLARIQALTNEANKLTAVVREANTDTRASLARDNFRVIYSDLPNASPN